MNIEDFMSKNDDLYDAATDVAKYLTSFLNEVIDKEKDKHGAGFARTVELSVLAQMVCSEVTHILHTSSKLKGNKKKYKAAWEGYKAYREQIQHAMAAAFSSAMTAFSGQEVEYFCRIEPVPEPINKEPI